jgi:hypothetical protein
MSLERRLVIAIRPCQCSCPCAVVHRKPYGPTVRCMETMSVGSAVGVALIDGRVVGTRCLPCAMASGWSATNTPPTMARTVTTAAGVAT